MISFLVRNRIKQRALEWNIELQDNYELILNEYNKLDFLCGNKIRYSYLYDNGSTVINGNGLIYRTILINAEWAARLVLFNDKSTENAFLFTLGHELTHKEQDFFRIVFHKNDYKFIFWTNEVHADFGAAKKVASSNKIKLMESIAYKANLNKNSQPTMFHPSWQQRKTYAETGTFNKDLIEMIANQTGCTNNKLINEISKFYGDIVLKD